MLSELRTPWTNPATIQLAVSAALTRVTSRRKAGDAILAADQVRVVVGDGVRQKLVEPGRFADVREPLKGAEANVRVAQANEHRRSRGRWLVAALEHLTGLEEAERLRRVDAERLEHLGGEHLTYAALERQSPVRAARPRGLAAALGAQIEQAPGVVFELREEEASSVSERGVVHVELVSVVAQRQRFLEVLRERLEPREVSLPLGRIELAQPDALCPALVAKAQLVLRKARCRHLVVEAVAEAGDARSRVGTRAIRACESGRILVQLLVQGGRLRHLKPLALWFVLLAGCKTERAPSPVDASAASSPSARDAAPTRRSSMQRRPWTPAPTPA